MLIFFTKTNKISCVFDFKYSLNLTKQKQKLNLLCVGIYFGIFTYLLFILFIFYSFCCAAFHTFYIYLNIYIFVSITYLSTNIYSNSKQNTLPFSFRKTHPIDTYATYATYATFATYATCHTLSIFTCRAFGQSSTRFSSFLLLSFASFSLCRIPFKHLLPHPPQNTFCLP